MAGRIRSSKLIVGHVAGGRIVSRVQRKDVEKDDGAASLDQQPVHKRIVLVQSKNALDVEAPRG